MGSSSVGDGRTVRGITVMSWDTFSSNLACFEACRPRAQEGACSQGLGGMPCTERQSSQGLRAGPHSRRQSSQGLGGGPWLLEAATWSRSPSWQSW